MLKPPPLAQPRQPASKPTDDGERRRICDQLHLLVLARISEAYQLAGITESRDMQKPDYKLPASGLASHDEKLRGAQVVLDPSTFAQWRKQYEAQDALADGAGPSTAPPQKKKPRK